MTERITTASLAALPCWVAWQTQTRGPADTKPTKVPYAPGGPDSHKAKADSPTTWGTREQAEARAGRLAKPFGLGGVGVEFTTLADGRSTGGIDLDDCRDPATGELARWARTIVDRLASYTEISPSGSGVKVFFLYTTADTERIRKALGVGADGKLKHSRLWARRTGGDHPPAIEIHVSNRYFAITDELLPGATDEWRAVPTEELLRLIEVDGPAFMAAGQTPSTELGVSDDEADAAIAARSKRALGVGGDRSRSAMAFKVGGAARRKGATFEKMCEAIRDHAETAEWFREKGNDRELRRIWDRTDPALSELILSPGMPLVSARRFLAIRHTADEGRTLHHQNATFYVWRRSHYIEQPGEEIRAELYAFLDKAKQMTGGDPPDIVDFAPTKSKVANVVEATAAEAQLSVLIRPPAWLAGEGNPDPREVIACRNTLLHLPTGDTRNHTPSFFTLNALTFDYQPKAPLPANWLAFLASVWPNDQQAVDTLQELFGLCLTAETKYQKAFLLVGPKRSGKGTIARVLTDLLGRDNVAGPTLSGLGTNFGLAPLIGKRLAIISDARLSGKADQQVIVERLLSITGEDGLTVDRKFKDGWTGKLDARFVILTNEMPKLTDSSGALASRFVILRMMQSFYGKEDLALGNKLEPELPGILCWAIEGWKRLTMRGYFVPPASSADAQRELEDLGSPIGAFLRDCCLIAPGYSVDTVTIYQAWCDWCREQGRTHFGTAQTFGSDLRAAAPGVKSSQPSVNGKRFRQYEGVKLIEDYSAKREEAERAGTRTTPLYSNSHPDDPGYDTDRYG